MAATSAADLATKVEAALTAEQAALADSSGAERGRTIEILRSLLACNITMQLLVDTGVGKKLRKLAKSNDAEIAKAASEVVQHWKDAVKQEQSSAASSAVADSAGPASNDALRQANSLAAGIAAGAVASQDAEVPVDEAAAPPAPRDSSGDGQLPAPKQVASTSGKAHGVVPPLDKSKLPKTGDSTRDRGRDVLAEAFYRAVKEGVEGDPIAAAVVVENAIHAFGGGGANPKYKAKFRTLSFNLKDEKNPDLRRRVLLGEVEPEVVVNMAAEDLASDAQKEQNQEIRKRKLFDANPGAQKKATTDQFQCGKCRQRKCTYYQMQTRSADEPMTTFVSCLNCDNRWKFC